MGDPRKIRKKFESPMHPWIGSRIEEERKLKREHGLRNKREIWRMETTLKGFKDRAKRLLARTDSQAEKERQQLIDRMARLGLISKGASTDDILGLSVQGVMGRRLQNILIRKNLARSPKQARQMITHRHVMIGGKVVTSPAHLVTVEEEPSVQFASRSAFFNEAHPERFSEEELARKREKEAAKGKKAAKAEEEVLAYDEKAIEEAEALAGEKKMEKKKADEEPDEEKKEGEKEPKAEAAKKEPAQEAKPTEEKSAAQDTEPSAQNTGKEGDA